MTTEFDAYSESNKKMYAEYAHWADIHGVFSYWAKDGTYKYWINNHTRQHDIWDKREREREVHRWSMERWEQQKEEDRIQRNRGSRPWYEEEEHGRRVDESRAGWLRRAQEKEEQTEWEIHAQKKEEQTLREQKQRKIDAAISFLAGNGIDVQPQRQM